MNRLLLFSLIGLVNSELLLHAQNDFSSWDANYKHREYSSIINSEKAYADSIERNTAIAPYYTRIDKYKINAVFTGQVRKVDAAIRASANRVFKIYMGNPKSLDEMLHNEYKFIVDATEVWMPIQKVLEKPIKKELLPGDKVTLYCLFLNEHTMEKDLYTIFLISEFRRENWWSIEIRKLNEHHLPFNLKDQTILTIC